MRPSATVTVARSVCVSEHKNTAKMVEMLFLVWPHRAQGTVYIGWSSFLHGMGTIDGRHAETNTHTRTRLCTRAHTHTHTHAHAHTLNGPFSETTQVSRYKKGKTNLDFTEAMSGSGISWAICKPALCSRETATPASHYSAFFRPDAHPAAQPTVSTHWRQ